MHNAPTRVSGLKRVKGLIMTVFQIFHDRVHELEFYVTFPVPLAGARVAVGGASDSKARGPGFETPFSHIHVLSFLLPLIQEGQLPVTGESICT